jgi:hypothetical protein
MARLKPGYFTSAFLAIYFFVHIRRVLRMLIRPCRHPQGIRKRTLVLTARMMRMMRMILPLFLRNSILTILKL